MMKVYEILNILDQIAPFFLQESFDNSGIQFADLDKEVNKVLLSLDSTQEVLEEAITNKANLIITHHPLIFSPLKRISRQDNPILFKVFTNNINLISFHTNFDLAENGLNDYLTELLRIKKIEPIQHSSEKTYKFAVYVPIAYVSKVSEAIFKAGAGKIGNYTETSFNIRGKGTFKPEEGCQPFIGEIGKREEVEEIKIETVVTERFLKPVIQAMKNTHPYEEPAYDIFEIFSTPRSGIGWIGEVEKTLSLNQFSQQVKATLQAKYIRLIESHSRPIKKVALCAGGGSFLLEQVSKLDVDLYITGDIKYHDALRAKEIGLNILEIEHFDTEKFFVDALYDKLIKFKIPETILIKSKKLKSPYQLI